MRYYYESERYIKGNGYNDIDVLVDFSDSVNDGDKEYTESKLNGCKGSSHILALQTKTEFHENFNMLIVAEKYQISFDEPMLHTIIIDKKFRGVKAVQALSCLNRAYQGKTDTFVLNFINKQENIQDVFQPFYQETMLEHEVNTDLL